MVFSHFNLTYQQHKQQTYEGAINANQSESQIDGFGRYPLKILSEMISRGAIEKLNRVESGLIEKDFSRILRTSHSELLKSVSESEDLKDDLIDELVNDLADIPFTLDTPKTLRVTVNESLERVKSVLRKRTYDRDDGAGYVTL